MRLALLALFWSVVLVACTAAPKSDDPPNQEVKVPEPEHIEVDHILIAVSGPRMEGVSRTPAEADTLARKLLADLESGDGDWTALKLQYSADPPPGGPYKLANHGVNANSAIQEYPRGNMVAAFGDVGFKLEVGKIGLAEYDQKTSPYGYHIIKRTQ